MPSAIAVLCVALSALQPVTDYPALYRQLQLPELPGAVVTNAGRQATSLVDGLRVDVETTQDVPSVLKFFRDRLMANGWTETPSRAKVVLTTVGRVQFTKDRLTFSAMATQRGQTVVVQMTVFERSK